MSHPALVPAFARAPLAFTHGSGVRLFDRDGRRFLDFAAGIASDSLGHAHPALVAALKQQADRLWHVSNLYEIPEQTRYAASLVAASFADAAFFCNSGGEAIEGALKLARRCQFTRGHPERFRTVTVAGAFHGRTLATISASGNPKYLHGFGPPVDGFDQVPFDNLNALRAAITPETAAIMLEPVQGEGGIRPMSADYLRAVRAAADEFGLLLIFDEVQCGFGRTGKLFAHEHAGIAPDIMAVAKGIAGGFPCGAFLARRDVADTMAPGSHGTTFGGNPLAMAVAAATLDIVQQPAFLDAVAATGRTLGAVLETLVREYPSVVAEARGIGLIRGIRLTEAVRNADFVARAQDRGLLSVPAGDNVVRFVPPLVAGAPEVAEAGAILQSVCADIAATGRAAETGDG